MATGSKFKITILLILLRLALCSQTSLNVRVSDVQKRPIPSAILKYGGSTFVCNNSGAFRISNYKPGTKIMIHKFGFADTTVSMWPGSNTEDSLSLFIKLRLKPTVLPEVSVSSSFVQEINPVKTDFVLGYELKGDYLVELLSDDIVLVTDVENKVKSRSKPISKARDIVKDVYGNIHITTDKNAYKIYPDSLSLRVDKVSVDLAKLNWNMQYCDEVSGTSLFIRRYKDNNQTMAFFATSSQDKNRVKLLKEITDADRSYAVKAHADETNSLLLYLASLEETNPAGAMGEISGGDLELYRKSQQMLTMLEKNYALPSYNFLKLVNDSVYLFAHDIDSMFVYDQGWKLVKSKPIDYHHLKIWDKELIVNEEKTKVYAKLNDNSKTLLAEIDLQTGTLKPSSTKIEARFPSKIKIRNNVAYFMAKQKNGPGYTVYSQKLD